MTVPHSRINYKYKNLDEIWFDALMGRHGDYLKAFTRFAVITNPTVDVKQDMWEHTSNLVYLTIAETLSVVSTSVNDTGLGTGTRAILIVGLDNDYNSIQELVFLTGTTPVLTQQSFLRVHQMLTAIAGAGETNAGSITATASTAGTLQANILTGISGSRMGHFTVPAGYTALFIDGTASMFASQGSSLKVGEMETYLRFNDGRRFPGCSFGMTSEGTSITPMVAPYFVGWLPEKTDTKLSVTARTSNTKFTAFMSFLLIKDTEFYNLLEIV